MKRLVLIILLASPAMAADNHPILPRLPADAVREIMEVSRDSFLPKARLPDGTFVGKESAEDRAKPLLGPADAEHVIQLGIVSGLAEKCGLDWEKQNFAPLMRWIRSQKLPAKAVAYVAVLHNTSMSIPGRDKRPCSPQGKVGLAEYLKTRWANN